MQANPYHPHLVQGWNWNWFGGRGREKKHSHTIEWDRTSKTWRQVEAEITDTYFTWVDHNGTKHEKRGIEYVEACNSLFDDAAEAWDRFKWYFEEWEAEQSRSSFPFQGAKKLTMARIKDHLLKHRRRLIALSYYLRVLQEGWQTGKGKHDGAPVDEWKEVIEIRQTYFEDSDYSDTWAEDEITKLKTNYDRMYRGDWKAWNDELNYEM